MSILKYFIFGFFLTINLCLKAQNKELITFHTEGKIHLKWIGIQDSEVLAYEVYRKTEKEDWQKVNKNPIEINFESKEIQAILKHKINLFLSIFELEKPEDFNLSTYQKLMQNQMNWDFLQSMSIINSEFSKVLALQFVDENIPQNQKVKYLIKYLKNNKIQEYLESEWLETNQVEKLPQMQAFEAIGESNQVLLKWKKEKQEIENQKIVGYNLYRSTEILGNYILVNPLPILPMKIQEKDSLIWGNKEQYLDKYLSNNQIYYYKIKVINAFGIEGKPSKILEVKTQSQEKLLPPSKFKIEQIRNALQFSWDSVSGNILGYEIYKAIGEKKSFKLVYPKSKALLNQNNTWLDGKIQAGEKYYYFIKTINQAQIAGFSSDTILIEIPNTKLLAAPKNVQAIGEKGFVKLNWDKNTEANLLGYEIERSSDKNFENRFIIHKSILKENNFIDSLPEYSEIRYGYLVYAIDKNYKRSLPSKMIYTKVKDITAPQKPFIIDLENKNNIIKISWIKNRENDLESYKIYQSKENVNNFQVIQEINNSFAVVKIKESGKYYFAISAKDKSGNESEKSNILSIDVDLEAKPKPPKNGKIKIENNRAILTWEASESKNIKGYLITRINLKTNETIDLKELKADELTYTDKFFKKYLKYHYEIRSINQAWTMSEPLLIKN